MILNPLNLEQSFKDLLDHIYVQYRDEWIEKDGYKFKTLNQTFDNLHEAKKAIDKIKKTNHVN